ncbi:MAG TPA: Sec-independent protein translocase subunit TatB [Helicobacteraceae bacterium]|nr:Sec-independent protein translocase subunit TatB [Helicobacteraceae bacterium]
MFGMGFAEILIIGVIAILFLGPEKLPTAMVEIAKFFRSVKRTVASAKDSLEEELHVSDIKEEAMNYKKQLVESQEELGRITSMNDLTSEINKIKEDANVDLNEAPERKAPAAPKEPEAVTFDKKKPSENA